MKHPAGFIPTYPRLILRPEEPRHVRTEPHGNLADAVGNIIVWPVDDQYEEQRNEQTENNKSE